MTTPKNAPKKTAKPVLKPENKNSFYITLILVSLAVNGYLLLYKQDKKQQPLVTMGGQTFRWSDVSSRSKEVLARFDENYYAQLKREADTWVENQVLPKEAQALSMSVPELLSNEVGKKVQVTKEEVYARYAQSPQADFFGWPQVLSEIENELRGRQYQQHKDDYMNSLYAKYGVRYLLKSPRGDTKPAAASSRFPIYERRISAAPLRGSANAPIFIEVFSDFMCPYSVKFNASLEELRKIYPDKLQVAYKHFPLPMHEGAHLMAEASMCAEEQGKFWEYHDKLMVQSKKREKPELVQMASDLGLSTPRFIECLESGRFAKKVDEDIALGKASGVQGTPGYLINGRRGSGVLPVETLKSLMDWHLNPSGVYPGKPAQPATPSGQKAPNQAQGGLDPNKIYALDAEWLKKGYSQGPADAPVTLVEFFDYNCPFCKKGAEVSDALADQYGSKIKRVAKHFPLPMHANAAKTAEALLCANEQSKFMEFRKLILGEAWGKTSADELKAAAKKMGLNEANFNTCLDSGKMKAVVDEDMKMAGTLGVRSTPTFIVSGTPVIGAQPVEAFKKIIDEKLSAKK